MAVTSVIYVKYKSDNFIRMTKESSVFFPEEMEYVELIVPHESAYFAIKRLSKGNIIHLIDENSKGTNKRYTDDFMRCEDADHCLRFIQTQLEQYELLSPPLSLNMSSFFVNPP